MPSTVLRSVGMTACVRGTHMHTHTSTCKKILPLLCTDCSDDFPTGATAYASYPCAILRAWERSCCSIQIGAWKCMRILIVREVHALVLNMVEHT